MAPKHTLKMSLLETIRGPMPSDTEMGAMLAQLIGVSVVSNAPGFASTPAPSVATMREFERTAIVVERERFSTRYGGVVDASVTATKMVQPRGTTLTRSSGDARGMTLVGAGEGVWKACLMHLEVWHC